MAGSGLDSGGSKTVGDGAEGGRGPGQTQLCTHNTPCYTCIMHDMNCWTCCRRFARTFCALSLFIFKSLKTGHSGFSIIEKNINDNMKNRTFRFFKVSETHMCCRFCLVTNTRRLRFWKTWHSGFRRIENMTFRFLKNWKHDIQVFEELKTRPR